MANSAFVYGGNARGRPIRTSFSMLPPDIADNHSQQQMATIQAPPAATPNAMVPAAAPAASPAAPDFSHFGAFGQMAGRQQQRAGGAAAPAADANPNDPFTIIRNLLSGANSAHGGNALGPEYLTSLLRKSAFQRSRNQRRRGDILSRLAGLDPFQQQQAMVDSDRAASGDLTDALNTADIQGGQGYIDHLMQLLSGERGYQNSGVQQQYAAGEARGARQGQGGIGGFLGQVAGAAIPGIGSLLHRPSGGSNGQSYYDPNQPWLGSS